MSTNKAQNLPSWRTDPVAGEDGAMGRLTWLRPRRVVFLGVALFGILLAIFVGIRFLGSQDPLAVAAQSSNDPLSSRAYQFTGQGKVQGGSGATWVIGGVPVQVGAQTQIESGVHPGDSVSVFGHITQDGKWLAERINLISEQESFFSFGGPLEVRSQNTWKVAGISVTVNDRTQLGASLQDNELVLVTFKVLPDGTWLALNITSLAESATPTPSPESAADKKPTVSDQQPPSIKPSDKNNKVPGCYKSNGKGKWKHNNGGNPCVGGDQGGD